jgi:hypothetical protein
MLISLLVTVVGTAVMLGVGYGVSGGGGGAYDKWSRMVRTLLHCQVNSSGGRRTVPPAAISMRARLELLASELCSAGQEV